jgi:serine/threonine protein kinase
MSLAVGTRLGPYEIESLLGEGGMGEVYKARDTLLKREVALKILPSGVALDPERLGRFDREAQTLAALNHPRIAQVYGFVREANARAIVMELVEGLTLAGRIARGPIPLDDALRLAIQLAEALEYAHERGIVHRDLKPANITLTPDGDVKVLDFGLAKILTEEVGSTPGTSPTMTTCPAISRAGVILGTAAYMAPEQARGEPVDRRADIWAFGVVLFEVLTGKRCFSGETWTDVLAAVVNSEPDWSVLSAAIPSRLHELVQRCLAKDRKQRLHDIGDARLELQSIAAAARSPREAAAPAATARRRRATMVALVALTAIAAAAAGVAGGRLLSRPVT